MFSDALPDEMQVRESDEHFEYLVDLKKCPLIDNVSFLAVDFFQTCSFCRPKIFCSKWHTL